MLFDSDRNQIGPTHTAFVDTSPPYPPTGDRAQDGAGRHLTFRYTASAGGGS